MNDKGELLIQRRSMGVQWKPGIWAVTGGSAVSGEEPLDRRDGVSCGKNWAMPLPKQTKCSLSRRLRRSNSYCYVYAVKTQLGLKMHFTLTEGRSQRCALVFAPAV